MILPMSVVRPASAEVLMSERSATRPILYHAPSSYYSMIARLALAEGGIAYEAVYVDIHIRMAQQRSDYARLNPEMSVPTLVLPKQTLIQSREIAEYAVGVADVGLDPETRFWVDLHYAFSIEELTFGGFLAGNPIARFVIPKRLEAARHRLLAMAAQHPDLATAYRDRAAVFAERLRVFDPHAAAALAKDRRTEAGNLMDRLEHQFVDSRPVIVPPAYGVADVVWTVFLARIEFAGLGTELERRPALSRYWNTMRKRPSFVAADIWTKTHMPRLIGGILGFGHGTTK